MSAANLLIGFAVWGWWLQHTAFDPGRVTDVADRVLAVDAVQRQITDAITEAVAVQLGQDPDTIALVVEQAATTPSGVDLLADVVVESHRVLIGRDAGPVVITPEEMVQLLGDDRAALLPAVTLPVTTIGPLDTLRRFLDATVAPAFVLALILAGFAVVVHPQRDRLVRRWGFTLMVLGVLVLAIGYLVPTVVLPSLTTSPWVQAIPEIANGQLQLLLGISLVCAGAGLGLVATAAAMRRTRLERDAATRGVPQQTWGRR